MADKVIFSLEQGDSLLRITLNAPKGNILDIEMIRAIDEGIRTRQAGLKGIVFEGAGKHFSFGASVSEHRAEEAPAMLEAFHGLFLYLAELGVPTLAAVRGYCIGGGLELAAYCTYIFAHSGAKFAQPEISLAVFPPMASILLPWRLGGAAGLDLCVSGRTLDCSEALSRGLVHATCEDPSAAASSFFSAHLAPLSASSLRFAERAARISLRSQLETELPKLERMYIEELMRTRDANEGIAAFLEKRPPSFGTNSEEN